MIKPLAGVLLAASILWGAVTLNPANGEDLYRNGALFIGKSVTNWVMYRIEATLKAVNLPVPEHLPNPAGN